MGEEEERWKDFSSSNQCKMEMQKEKTQKNLSCCIKGITQQHKAAAGLCQFQQYWSSAVLQLNSWGRHRAEVEKLADLLAPKQQTAPPAKGGPANSCQLRASHWHLSEKCSAPIGSQKQKPTAFHNQAKSDQRTLPGVLLIYITQAAAGSCQVCSSHTRLVTTRPTADYLLDVLPAMGSTRSDRAQIRWGFNPALECTHDFSTQPFAGATSTRVQQQSSNATSWLRTGPPHRNGRIHPHVGLGSTPEQGFNHKHNTRAQELATSQLLALCLRRLWSKAWTPIPSTQRRPTPVYSMGKSCPSNETPCSEKTGCTGSAISSTTLGWLPVTASI